MKSNLSPEQTKRIAEAKVETAEEFLARGGVIHKVATGVSGKYKSTSNGINPQKLLDLAVGTKMEAEVIKFLASQGYDVE